MQSYEFDRFMDALRDDCGVPEDLLSKLKEYRPLSAPHIQTQIQYLRDCQGEAAEKYLKQLTGK